MRFAFYQSALRGLPAALSPTAVPSTAPTPAPRPRPGGAGGAPAPRRTLGTAGTPLSPPSGAGTSHGGGDSGAAAVPAGLSSPAAALCGADLPRFPPQRAAAAALSPPALETLFCSSRSSFGGGRAAQRARGQLGKAGRSRLSGAATHDHPSPSHRHTAQGAPKAFLPHPPQHGAAAAAAGRAQADPRTARSKFAASRRPLCRNRPWAREQRSVQGGCRDGGRLLHPGRCLFLPYPVSILHLPLKTHQSTAPVPVSPAHAAPVSSPGRRGCAPHAPGLPPAASPAAIRLHRA